MEEKRYWWILWLMVQLITLSSNMLDTFSSHRAHAREHTSDVTDTWRGLGNGGSRWMDLHPEVQAGASCGDQTHNWVNPTATRSLSLPWSVLSGSC